MKSKYITKLSLIANLKRQLKKKLKINIKTS